MAFTCDIQIQHMAALHPPPPLKPSIFLTPFLKPLLPHPSLFTLILIKSSHSLLMAAAAAAAADSTSSMVHDPEPPPGSESQLLKIRDSQLFLVHKEQSMMMKSGDFAITFTKQSVSPLAAIVASVGDINWPLGRDSPVLRIGNRQFTFALPSLVYGLILAEQTPVEAMHCLEQLLTIYSTFEGHPQIRTDTKHGFSTQSELASNWSAMAPEILKLSLEIADTTCDSVFLPTSRCSSCHDSQGIQNGPRVMKRVQQARRLSAVSKLLSKTLLKGGIDVSNHVSLRFVPNVLNSSALVASVDAFTKILDAVESTGKMFAEPSSLASSDRRDILSWKRSVEESESQGLHSDVSTAWTLNRRGLLMLLRVTALSAKMHFSEDAF